MCNRVHSFESLLQFIERNGKNAWFLACYRQNLITMNIYYQKLILTLTIFCNTFALQNVAWAVQPLQHPNDSTPSIFDIISENDILEVTIKTDLQSLIENRITEDFQPATFSYRDQNGETITWEWKVQARGKFRRRICDFPPVKIKFKKKELEARGLHREYNDWKLVTHCVDDKEPGNENLLREYLAYELYREFTPNSFRTHLVKIIYEDTEGNLGRIKRYGFFIEDVDEMAARLGGLEYEQLNTGLDSVSARDEITMSLFQSMIGNADWNLAMLRNLKMVQPTDGSKMIPVPYDFDFSGLVNASYALPNGDLGLYSIRDRLYQGAAFDPVLMQEVIRHFLQKKASVIARVDNTKLLSREARKDIRDYLHSFFEALESAIDLNHADLQAFFALKNPTLEKLRYQQLQEMIGDFR